MRPNKIKQMWRGGQYVTLGWLAVSHGFTAEVMARQGFDALCVDLQHGTSEMNDVGPLLQAISQTDTVPVVRVAWNEPAAIMKALDLGAYGIIVPLVNTAAEAAMAVAASSMQSATRRASTPSISGPPTCRSHWVWPRAAITPTRCISPPATRSCRPRISTASSASCTVPVPRSRQAR
jgi:2-keto-3-deoxy-L-rhamnonate aldolase RhmA